MERLSNGAENKINGMFKSDIASRAEVSVFDEIIGEGEITSVRAQRLGATLLAYDLEGLRHYKEESGGSLTPPEELEILEDEEALLEAQKGDYLGVVEYCDRRAELEADTDDPDYRLFSARLKQMAAVMEYRGAPFVLPPPAWKDPRFNQKKA